MKKHIFIIIAIIISSFFSWKALLPTGYPSMHDDMQWMRIYEMNLCLKDNQFPCRWVPDLGNGFGYPLFNYYPPLPYYLAQIPYALGLSLLSSVKILFALGLVLSGIGMYFLAQEFWGKLGGFLSAIFYIYAPYHATDLYVRGAMAEHWALVWFPFILYAIYKLIKSPRLSWLMLLALSYGSLLTSHNIMSMLFSVAAFVWGILWLVVTKNVPALKKLIIGVFWGLGLAAFFIIPVLVEKKYAHTETMTMGYFGYLAHFATLKQLFLKTEWGWGASVGPDDKFPYMIGFYHWGLIIVNTLMGLIFWRKKKKRPLLYTTLFITIAFLSTAFMCHQRSTFIWKMIPPLEYLQFPWRFLGLVIFFASFGSGAVITLLQKNKFKYIAVILLTIGMYFSVSDYFRPEIYRAWSDRDVLTGAKWDLSLRDAIFDYLPVYAQYPPAEKAIGIPQIVRGQGRVLDLNKGTNWQKFTVETESDTVDIQPSLYDFPQWQVLIDNKPVSTNHDNYFGLVTFTAPQGSHEVSIRLQNTPIRTIANIYSLISWSSLIGLFLVWRLRKS